MEKLTKENIQFIETYLKNSDIRFVDIRMEMTDHVASSIETEIRNGDKRDFYYIFKDFMAVNKKSLLKEHDRFYRILDLKILKQIFFRAFTFSGLLILLVLFFSVTIVNKILTDETFFKLLRNLPFFVFITITVIYYFLIRRKKEKYSSLERIGFYLLFLYYIIYFFYKELSYVELSSFNVYKIIIPSVILIWLNVIILVFAIEIKKKYEFLYKNKAVQ